MRQIIEIKQENEITEKAVTVMFYDRKRFLGDFGSVWARNVASPSLSGALKLLSFECSFTSSLSGFVKVMRNRCASATLSPRRGSADRSSPQPALSSRRRSLSHLEKFSAGARIARSSCSVSGAPVDIRGMTAVTSQNHHTEQRCCFAA